jgi:L-gulono-1,4-lactone dehydrogenase
MARGSVEDREWRNWSGTERVRPVRWLRPRTVAEVSAAVIAAAADGLRVKAIGSGHSFTAISAAPDVLLDPSELNRVRRADTTTGLVTVEAGLPLYQFSPWLWRAGLSLTSLGDIDRQTVAGAISTGTHGTGLAFGSISSQVRGLELVLADGSVVTCSATERPDLFEAARVGLGAFGVITAVTMQCEPAFPIRAVEGPSPLAQALELLTAPLQQADHLEFFWFPHTDTVLLKSNQRLPPGTETEPPPRWRALLDDELVANGALDLVARTGAAMPSLIRTTNRFCTQFFSHRAYVDRSYRVFASRRRVVFRETEFGVPIQALPAVFAEINSWLERPGHEIGFPLEIRVGAAEDSWLSMAHGRRTAWISAQTYHKQPHEPLLRAVGEICRAYEGRPHWGKIHYLDAEALAQVYPRFADALAVRDQVDPDRRFANPYLERVLGP